MAKYVPKHAAGSHYRKPEKPAPQIKPQEPAFTNWEEKLPDEEVKFEDISRDSAPEKPQAEKNRKEPEIDEYDVIEHRSNPVCRIIRVIVSVLSVLGIVFFCIPIAKSYFTVTSAIAVAFCVCVLLLANIKGVLTKHGERTGMNILWYLVSLVFFIAVCWFGFCTFQMLSVNYEDPKEDATVVVLGARVYESGVSVSLQNRLNAAKEYLDEHPDAKCIVTGGQGSDEPWTEASAAKAYLLSLGVKEDRILMEDKSTSTLENLSFSKTVLAENKLGNSIVVVTQNFHMFRASSQARDLGFTVYSHACKTNMWLFPTYYSRELLSITKYYIDKVI
ncbi:MAG: YdcF family protein [Clostridia bacterium]|nr:YdcF family protein [Clostridia bacterium]